MRRTTATREDSSQWEWAYNSRSEVIGGVKKDTGMTPGSRGQATP